MLYRRLFILGFLVFLAAGFSARAYDNPGKPAGFVNDYANLLSVEQKTSLENDLNKFDKETSNQISVVTIKSLNGDTIENFAVKLFADWKIGQDKKDNGVLLLIALDERKMRLEVGYGLEGALPDATANQIITKTLRPAFQNNDYYGGISQAVSQIMAATRGEYQAEPVAASSANIFKRMNSDLFIWLIVALFYGLSALRRRLAKSRAWWEGGLIGLVLGLIIALIFSFTLIFFLIVPAVATILGLGFDFLVSRVLPKPKPPGKGKGGGFWFLGGGSGGFGGSSGGGFGGFGGGGSGGGGSSGGW